MKGKRRHIGFLINPIAGMGGRVGLKGTDGVVDQAILRGAKPVAEDRAGKTLRAFKQFCVDRSDFEEPVFLACAGEMGEDSLRAAGFNPKSVIDVQTFSGADRTGFAVRQFLKSQVDLILFCGGDGTARDIGKVTNGSPPMLGIPSGVKMFSGVFGTTPERTAWILVRYLGDEIGTARADIMDLDEERYRNGEFVVALRDSSLTIAEPNYTQSSKSVISSKSDTAQKEEIAAYLAEMLANENDRLFLLGPGSTVQSVARMLDLHKTLLGVDAVVNCKVVESDVDESSILALLDRYPPGKIVLSPIGAQGFVLGRGNQQLSPAIVRRFGDDRICIVATPAKLAATRALRFDTGDSELDSLLSKGGFRAVITGYRRERAVHVTH